MCIYVVMLLLVVAAAQFPEIRHHLRLFGKKLKGNDGELVFTVTDIIGMNLHTCIHISPKLYLSAQSQMHLFLANS